MSYTPSNWYWIVAGDASQVWSSASASYVPVDDATYADWLAGGNFPTNILNMAELQEVLAEQYPAGMLETYCVYKRWLKEQGGITMTSGMPIATDDRSQAKINGVMLATTGKTNFATTWHAADGSFWPLQETDIVNMSTQLQEHINQCFAASSQTMAGIANGSITTLEQIDAAFGSILTRKG